MPPFLDFQQNPLWLNLLLFSLAACAIWYAGTRLEREADAIAVRTGLGHAFIGMLLLAGATSLPEIATTFTAIWIGNIAMAIHNLLGSVVFNTAALAIADVVAGGWALTHRSPHYVLIMEGIGVVFLVALVQMAGAFGIEPSRMSGIGADIAPIGWGAALILSYLLVLYVTHYSQATPRWRPTPKDKADRPNGHQRPQAPEDDERNRQEDDRQGYEEWSSPLLYGAFALTSVVVLGAGAMVTRTGDALAVQTGLGGSFVGFTLIALSTTLPEISTTISAARSSNYSMAVSNIFGSSAFVLMLLGLVALIAGRDALVEIASPSATFAAGLGVVVTLIYLWGLLERRDRTVLRMGWDSTAVLVLVLAGSWMMFILK